MHVSFAFACNSHLRENRANMRYLFRVHHLSMLSSPYVALISLARALSQHGTGSLADPAADTHAHYQAHPRCPHTPEEATYTGGLLVREVVPPPPPCGRILGSPCFRHFARGFLATRCYTSVVRCLGGACGEVGHDTSMDCCLKRAAPIGLSPLTLVLSLNPFP